MTGQKKWLTVWFFYVNIHARIKPDNAFRVVLKVAKYAADGEYGLIEMAEQEHELWLDRSRGYSLSQFYDDMATKIIWGPSQTLALWVLDRDTGSEWKIRRDDHWQQMLKDKWDESTKTKMVRFRPINRIRGIQAPRAIRLRPGSVDWECRRAVRAAPRL